MGAPFRDITLYAGTFHEVGTPKYYEEVAIVNYICDFYVQCLHGYKPPNTTRISIQPSFYGIWNRTWKDGSLITMACYFDHDSYRLLDKISKYKYVLDAIHKAMLQLCEEYNWNQTVFENAYKEVITNNFRFIKEYAPKMAKDKKKIGVLHLEKTDQVTILLVTIKNQVQTIQVKLLDKKNWYWYDSVYTLVKGYKWFDNDRFGISIMNKKFNVWYSIEKNKVEYEINGIIKDDYDLEKLYTLQFQFKPL